MALVKLIRTGQAVVEWDVEDGTSVGAFLTARGVDYAGKTLSLNGESVSADAVIDGDSQLLVTGAVKGGNA